MRLGFLLFLPKEETVVPEEVTPKILVPVKYQNLCKFLRSYEATQVPEVFSSNNSLKSCFSYGDIYDLIHVTEEVHRALMLDSSFDHDKILLKRHPNLIRSIFIARDGSFPDVYESLRKLRELTLRLSEGYTLRSLHPDVGVYTARNLASAEIMLSDLELFFMELFHEYRKPDIGDGTY